MKFKLYFYNYINGRAVDTQYRYANSLTHAKRIANLILEERGWKYYNVGVDVTKC